MTTKKNDEKTVEKFMEELNRLIDVYNIDELFGLPSHLVASIMWNQTATFHNLLQEVHEYYDEVNEEISLAGEDDVGKAD